MQNGLLERPVYEKQALLDHVCLLAEAFRRAGLPVVFLRHTNDSFSKLNTPAWEIADGLHPSETDAVFNKTHSSAFKEKVFTEYLDKKNIHRIAIAGLVSNGCVQAACTDALKLGYHVTLAQDAHSTWGKDAAAVIKTWNETLAARGANLMTAKEIAETVGS
jgi:nicotinamidase-related amidase